MAQNQVDLANVFGMVTQALAQNQQTLNQSDPYNQNHGSNMVQTFETITQTLQQKKGSSNSAALNYAARQVSQNTSSGSGQLYAQHLAQASTQFKGKAIDTSGALGLLQTLIGGQTSQPGQQQAGGDALGSLLNSLNSGAQSAAPNAGGLGGLTGNQASSTPGQSGIGVDNLINAGMAFFQAKQQGGSTMQAAVQAFTAGSGMGQDPHRQQSTAVVVNSFLQALRGMGG